MRRLFIALLCLFPLATLAAATKIANTNTTPVPVIVTEDTTNTLVKSGDATNKAVRVNVVTGTVGVQGVPTTAAAQALTVVGKATVTTAQNAKASAGNLYGFTAHNGAAGICWFQCVDSATNGTLGTAVIFQVALPASTVVSFAPGTMALANGTNGIACGFATAVNGASACGTAGNFAVYIK